MEVNMKKWIALSLVLLLCFIVGCKEDPKGPNGPEDEDPGMPWTLEQVGGEDFLTTTTAIKITFEEDLNILDKGDNLNNIIEVMGAGVRSDRLSKPEGANYILIPIDVIGAGTATVIVNENNRGIQVTSKPVVVFKEWEFAPITWTVVANGDPVFSTNKLTFTFTGDIQGEFYLTTGMIRIDPDPDVEMKQRGNGMVTSAIKLPGDGHVFEIGINTSNGGWILITLDMDGVDPFPQRLSIILGSNDTFKRPTGSGESSEEVENGGENVAFKWTVVTVVEPDEESGAGNIVGADLAKIRAAYNKDWNFYNSEKAGNPNIKGGYGSFLRIYADISGIFPEEVGHAMLAVGNQRMNLGLIEDSLAMQNYTIQPLEGKPVGPGIVTMDVPLRFIIPDYCGPSDNYLFVNAWSTVYIIDVVLYEIDTPIKLERPDRWKRDIAMTGSTDRIGGAGAYFTYYDEEEMNNAPAGAWIEFYVKGSGAGNWGSTGYNWTVGRGGNIALPNNQIQTDPVWGRYNRVDVSTIKASKDTGNLDRNTLNPYAGSAFEKVWLCW